MDKNTPFPECAKNCEVIKMLGVGECESVCGHKFDTSERQLTIPDVVGRSEPLICQCDEPADNAYLNGTIFCENCGLNTWAE